MPTPRSSNKSRLGYESASTNTSQSPVAAEAPLLRAREIWFIGSNTTVASAARAFSAVRSVELLSQTMSSLSQPSAAKASVAALILRSERAMNFSSLNAGTMIEIFTRAFGNARPRKSQKPTGQPLLSKLAALNEGTLHFTGENRESFQFSRTGWLSG